MTHWDPTGHYQDQASGINAGIESGNLSPNPNSPSGYSHNPNGPTDSNRGGPRGDPSTPNTNNGPGIITDGNGAAFTFVRDNRGHVLSIDILSGNFDNSRNTHGFTVNVGHGASVTNPKGHNHNGAVNNWGTVHNYGYIGTLNNFGGSVNNYTGGFIKNLHTSGGRIHNDGRINNYNIYGNDAVRLTGKGTIGATYTHKGTLDVGTHGFAITLITKFAGTGGLKQVYVTDDGIEIANNIYSLVHNKETNEIQITMYLNFVNKTMFKSIGALSFKEYKNLFIKGVQEHWSGTFGDYKVTTTLKESSKGVTVYIYGRGGRSEVFGWDTWSILTPGEVHMYVRDKVDGKNRALYTPEKYMWAAAHEFGHLLGVDDAYTNDLLYKNVTSIFNRFWTPVRTHDIEKVLKAWEDNEFQSWDEEIKELIKRRR